MHYSIGLRTLACASLAAFLVAACDRDASTSADRHEARSPVAFSERDRSDKENAVDKLIAKLRSNNFYDRIDAIQALEKMGAEGVPAIPVLMILLGDERDADVPNASLVVNGQSAMSVADQARLALKKLIPLANGFGFERARDMLLSPLPNGAWPEEMARRKNLAAVLPAYGEAAFPLLLTVANLYGDEKEASILRIMEASTFALGDFGKSSIEPLCSIVVKHPSWSVRRIAAIQLSRNNGRLSPLEPDQTKVREEMCPQ
jgi:HEAT repeat protein